MSKEKVFARIQDALATGAQAFLGNFRSTLPGETMYSFLFELPCEGTHAHAAVATEEGLIRVAEKYAGWGYRAKDGDTAVALRTWLRWAGPEDGWFQGGDMDCFVTVSDAVDEAVAAGHMEPFDGQLNTLALAALRAMDARGVFGVGIERDMVVLGMCYIGGDNSDEEFLGWAEEVNPPAVMSRLRREIKESRATDERIARPKR
jgi:hypothetical protein